MPEIDRPMTNIGPPLESLSLETDLRMSHEERLTDIVVLVESFSAERAQLREALVQAEARASRLSRELDSAREADRGLRAETDALREEIRQLRMARDALLASTSWRITAPLRRVRLALGSLGWRRGP